MNKMAAFRCFTYAGCSILLLLASIETHIPIPLWPPVVPGSFGTEERDTPALTAYLAQGDKPSAALVILPGGGYASLAPATGRDYAEWLSNKGISCFVLRYRLGSAGYHHPRMMEDAARAIRTVRAKAVEWKVDPKRVGIMGSSAGGHLASTLLTHFDAGDQKANDPIERQSSRPDLGILCYPVITIGTSDNLVSRTNLLGGDPDPLLIQELSNETHVTAETPTCFLWHTREDTSVKSQNSLAFALSLQTAGVPYELHIYDKGTHGLNGEKNHPWATNCLRWLRERSFIQ
ncbi:MAG: endo,4-beta-xylanase [Verrucomicrobiales bacterium]|nr:endo,4-beta-xylanase [Verrucomicrobiales bacterium]